jgi:hypothetical protein
LKWRVTSTKLEKCLFLGNIRTREGDDIGSRRKTGELDSPQQHGPILLYFDNCLLYPHRSLRGGVPEPTPESAVIPSYNFNFLGGQWFLQGVMAEFAEHAPFKVTFLHENLQLAEKASDQRHLENMAASLRIKYTLEEPDLIIVQYKQALQFIREYGQSIFGNVPVVFLGLTAEARYNQIQLPDNFTGITASLFARKNIELILQNHPHVKKIYVVAGSSPIE